MLNKDNLKVNITDEIFDSYTRKGFGKLLKAEIDLIMFDFALKLIFSELKPEYFIEDELNYFLINKQDIYELTKKLKIPESKVIGLIEQTGLVKGLLEDSVALNYFRELLKQQKQSQKSLKYGYFQCYVPNKLMKNFIEAKVESIGLVPYYLENQDILKLELSVILEIFEKDDSVLESWISKLNKEQEDNDLKMIQKKINSKKITIKDISSDILKQISSKFVGKSSDYLVDSIFDMFDK